MASVGHVEWQIGVVSAFVPRHRAARRSPVIGRRRTPPCDCLYPYLPSTVYVNAVRSPALGCVREQQTFAKLLRIIVVLAFQLERVR